MNDTEILNWIDENPEGFTRDVVRKSWGRAVWWIGPDSHPCQTLRECVKRANKQQAKKEHNKNNT